MTEKKSPAAANSGAPSNAIVPGLGQILPHGGAPGQLLPAHVDELRSSAIPLEVAVRHGVYSAETVDDLPEWGRWIGGRDGALPALVYPMTECDGTVTGQVKPRPGSVSGRDGRELKYVGPSKRACSGAQPPQLPVVREVDDADTVLIVEGVKQALAADAWAADDLAVYRIAGVWAWKADGSPTPHLAAAVAGRRVVIVGDADAATNSAVYDGLTALGKAAGAAGATSVAFARVPGAGKDGLDDVLAGQADGDARRALMAELVVGAAHKPADLSAAELKELRAEQRRKDAERTIRESAGDRVDIALVGDHHVDCMAVADLVVDRVGGRELFVRGGGLVERVSVGTEVALSEVDGDDLHRVALGVVRLIGTDREGNPVVVPGLKRDAVGIVRGHVRHRLPEVVRVSTAPVVREDGSIVTRNGFDEATGVFVDLADDVRNLVVPEHPSDAQIEDAVRLLRDGLFGVDGTDGFDGWVFASEADRTHAIVFLLTCLTRSAMPSAPMMVLDGLQRGVGKGALIQTVHRVAYGGPATVMAAPATDAELEKRVTAELMAGRSLIVLDEVMDGATCKLRSPALTAALTTPVWGGRRLGRSEAVGLRQDSVWAATGNNVDVPGDMVRRILPIRLSSDREDLDTRDNFRHDLDRWVPEHRADLLAAALTLVRAWYDRGQPDHPRRFGFVGFTEWQRVVGGICHMAGLAGFLDGVLEVRRTADSEAVDWADHLVWLEGAAAGLQTAPRFTARDVLAAAKADPDADAPYGVSWEDLDARRLGRLWKGVAGRWFDGRRIVADGKAHGNVSAWRVESRAPVSVSAPAAPTEHMQVKGRGGHVETHVRVMPEIEGESIASMGGDRDA